MNKTTAESQAKELLKQETGVTRSYESLRKSFNGYSEFYMFKNKDKQHLTTSADLATMVQFARFDIILGTTMAELVHACCMQAPKKRLCRGDHWIGQKNKPGGAGGESI